MKKGTFRSYATGFILSIILTVGAYTFVQLHVLSHHKMFSHEMLTYAFLGLAVLQFIVQLVFFLHLADESKPRWNLVVFLSTLGIVLILVVGSLWIMNHLNYHMTPTQMDIYMMKNPGAF
jgi:cytochrome o ubiquinol oxidase operon protein cyoD